MDTNRVNRMASRKYLRLLWEIVFPYEIRWGIEKVPDKASAHGVKNLPKADAPTLVPDHAEGSVSPRSSLTVLHNPHVGESERTQRAS
jgi:hypothetical protein